LSIRKVIRPVKLVPVNPKGCLLKQLEEANQWQLANPGLTGK